MSQFSTKSEAATMGLSITTKPRQAQKATALLVEAAPVKQKSAITAGLTTIVKSPYQPSPVQIKYEQRLVRLAEESYRRSRAARKEEAFLHNKKYFVQWYKRNRADLNYYFKDILYSIIKNRIYVQVTHTELYNQFVDFTFENSKCITI